MSSLIQVRPPELNQTIHIPPTLPPMATSINFTSEASQPRGSNFAQPSSPNYFPLPAPPMSRRSSIASLTTLSTYLQGSCPRCHHFHAHTPLTISSRHYTGVRCEKCAHKWFGVGGARTLTRLSLLSQETIAVPKELSPACTNASESIKSVIGALATAAVGSPSATAEALRSPESRGTKRPRADSGGSRTSRKTLVTMPGLTNEESKRRDTTIPPEATEEPEPEPEPLAPIVRSRKDDGLLRRRLSRRLQRHFNNVLRKYLKCELRRVDPLIRNTPQASSAVDEDPIRPSTDPLPTTTSIDYGAENHAPYPCSSMAEHRRSSAPAFSGSSQWNPADTQSHIRREKTLKAHALARARHVCSCEQDCWCRNVRRSNSLHSYPSNDAPRFSFDSSISARMLDLDEVPGDILRVYGDRRDSALLGAEGRMAAEGLGISGAEIGGLFAEGGDTEGGEVATEGESSAARRIGDTQNGVVNGESSSTS